MSSRKWKIPRRVVGHPLELKLDRVSVAGTGVEFCELEVETECSEPEADAARARVESLLRRLPVQDALRRHADQKYSVATWFARPEKRALLRPELQELLPELYG